jgi:nucleotide-binding universal stress UspA family protein
MSNDAAAQDHTDVPEGAIVVGLDGSSRDLTCLEWAARSATRGRRPLHLLHAEDVAAEMALTDPSTVSTLDLHALDVSDSSILARAEAHVAEHWPELVVTTSSPWVHASQALIDASETAYVIVVGAARRGTLEKLVLGRASLATAMHSRCPVVVVPEGARTTAGGPIVVGIDGSSHSRAAAERAFWIAQGRETNVVAVATWYLEVVDGVVVTTPETEAYAAVEARYAGLVEKVVGPLRAQYPDVPVEVRVVRGKAAPTLVEVAADADLLVLGSRGRGGFRGMLLGSVSQKALETATCPVMIIREPAPSDAD